MRSPASRAGCWGLSIINQTKNSSRWVGGTDLSAVAVPSSTSRQDVRRLGTGAGTPPALLCCGDGNGLCPGLPDHRNGGHGEAQGHMKRHVT